MSVAVERHSVGAFSGSSGEADASTIWYRSRFRQPAAASNREPVRVQECGRSCAPTVRWVALGRTQEAPAGVLPPPTQEAPRTGRLEPDE